MKVMYPVVETNENRLSNIAATLNCKLFLSQHSYFSSLTFERKLEGPSATGHKPKLFILRVYHPT